MKKIMFISCIIITFISLTGCIQQTTVKNHAEIEITKSISTGYIKENNITIPFIISDGELAYADPVISFDLDIIPPTGSKTTEYYYILFKVHDFDKRMFRQSSGVYQLIWEDSNYTYLVNGEKRFYMDDSYDIQLTLRFDEKSIIDFGDTELYITFYYPDDSWSETFRVETRKVEL